MWGCGFLVDIGIWVRLSGSWNSVWFSFCVGLIFGLVFGVFFWLFGVSFLVLKWFELVGCLKNWKIEYLSIGFVLRIMDHIDLLHKCHWMQLRVTSSFCMFKKSNSVAAGGSVFPLGLKSFFDVYTFKAWIFSNPRMISKYARLKSLSFFSIRI